MAGFCEYCNESSGAIKFREFVEWLKSCGLLKKDSTLWS